MAKLFNRAKMDTSTTGSGTITLGSAVDGYQTFADAGVADSDVVQYVIEDGTSWEIGTGTYSATGTSLTRTPSESSNAGAAISLTGAAEVFITAVADDLNRLQNAGSDIVTVSSSGAAVTGNITVTGTVDGRDIASDGSKLDGIESGATADQTKADIDALGINADQVDGLEASQFLRSDANDTHAGTLTLDVVQVGNEIRLPNNTSLTDVSLTGTSDQDTGFNWSGSNAVNYVSGGVLQYNLNNVWHSGNDGSGSGLDADTLDGYHLSTTRNAANTVPVRDASGYANFGWINTTSGSTTSTIDRIYASSDSFIRYVTPATLVSQLGLWTSGNDGSGSGLDADTLDGVQGSSFLRSDANNSRIQSEGYATSWGVTSGTNTGAFNAIMGTSSAATWLISGTSGGTFRGGWQVLDAGGTSRFYLGSNYYTLSGSTGTIWHSGNDGSGSGLDADTVDGVHESTFMRRSANSHLDMNNYNITEINHLQFNDPGPNEGIEWVGGNGWKIYESPNDLTTNSGGNLQFVTGSTYNFRVDTSGNTFSRASSRAPNFYLDSAIYHTGDTNTYIQFHASDQFRVVTGGTERFEINNTRTQADNFECAGNITGGKIATVMTGTITTVPVGGYIIGYGNYPSSSSWTNAPVSSTYNFSSQNLRVYYYNGSSYVYITINYGTWRFLGRSYSDYGIHFQRIS